MIIDGQKLAKEIITELKPKFARFDKKVVLGAVVVGKNPASLSFLRQKEKTAKELGVEFKIFQFSSKISEKRLIQEVKRIGARKNIGGLIVQLPIGEKFNTQLVLDGIPPKKDIEVLTKHNLADFYLNQSLLLPPAVEVVKFVLSRFPRQSAFVTIVGFGRLVGKPMAVYFLNQQIATSIITETTSAGLRKKLFGEADILISGAGKANLIKGDWVKRNSIIFDFGCGFLKGKICGDIEVGKAVRRAALIVPTPGGTGPLLVAMLYQNLSICLRPSTQHFECFGSS